MVLTKILIVHEIIALTIFSSTCASISCGVTRKLCGAGSSFPAPLYQEAGAKYVAERRAVASVEFNFERMNSAYGKKRIKMEVSGQPPVHFAGTESILSEEDKQTHKTLVTFPVFAG